MTIFKNPKTQWALIASVILAFISIASLWVLLNLSHEPRYGDTAEYWKLSSTLNVDSWRTVGYPFILKIIGLVPNDTITRVLVYLLQLVAAFGAAYYFFATINKFSSIKIRSRVTIIAVSILLTATPMVAHFNLSILTDGLATSFMIIGMSGIVRLMLDNKPSRQTIIITFVSIIFAGLIREERSAIFAFTILSSLTYLIYIKRYSRTLILLSLAVPILLTVSFNKYTQETKPERPPLTIAGTLYLRFGRTIAYNQRFNMPEHIQEKVSPDLAKLWQEDEAFTLPVLAALNDQEGEKAMIDAVQASFSCCAKHISKEFSVDYIEYLLSPFTYMKETITPSFDPTRWTNTRMGMFHPLLTKIYLASSFILSIFLILVVGATRKELFNNPVVVYFLFLVLGLSLILAARSSLDFNIRYGLPIYFIELGLLLWCGVLCLAKHVSPKLVEK